MTEKCREVRDTLALEGRAPDDDRLREHLDTCPECARFLKSLLAVEDALQSYEPPDVSDEAVEKVLVSLPGRRSSTRYWVMGLAAAATIAFVAARVLFVSDASMYSVSTSEPSVDQPAARRASPAPSPPNEEEVDRLRSLGYIGGEDAQGVPSDNGSMYRRQLESAQPRSDDKDRDELGEAKLKKEDFAEGLSSSEFRDGRSRAEFEQEKAQNAPEPQRPAVGGFMDNVSPQWQKREHVDPVFPPIAVQARVEGTVVLRVEIDPEGNVTSADVVRSIPLLDQAAIDAVRQWKYEPIEGQAMREATVRVEFRLDNEPDRDASLSLLEERERVDGLRFQQARGYWANTYVPGDPKIRFLELRLRKATQDLKPHLASKPIIQPFDAPKRGAMSVFVHADRRGLSEPSRLLVQVGLKATEHHGRRRPPMNVGIVIDADAPSLDEARALVDALRDMKALGDRFRLVLPGRGDVVPPESFRHGPLTLALQEPADGDLVDAVRVAMEQVHAGDDPTMPLGTSLVLVVTSRRLGAGSSALTHLAHRSAVGGVPVSVVGVGEQIDREELERLALAGQGRRYFLDRSTDAARVVEEELAATSRVVARALRLRIKLAPGVKLVDVLDSEPLSERQADRVRAAEKSIDLRLARNLGIEADRGEDEDGIQMVIPNFYAGDAHTILLDVVAPGPGPIADVTLRYKDLAELDNTVAKASLSLPRSTATNGPLETNVRKNFLALHLARELDAAADDLDHGDRRGAIARLITLRIVLSELPFGIDIEIARDAAMLTEYVNAISSSRAPVSYLADSLRYAGATKTRSPAAST